MDSSLSLPRISAAATPLVGSIYAHTWSYLAFVLLGLGTFLPYHVFITADPYFRYKLLDQNSSNTSMFSLDVLYENTVTLCSSLPYLITVILVTFIYVPYIHKYRIYTSLSGITICFFICFSLAFVSVKQWRLIFFILIMILVMIQGICCAVLLNCFYSLASTLPSRYIQGFVSGQALGGVFVAICSIISILIFSNKNTSAAIYFLLAMLVLISNIIIYFFLEKTHLFQIYSSSMQEINNEHEPLFHASVSYDDNDNDFHTLSVTPLAIRQRLYLAFKHIKWNFFGVFVTHVSTLAVFPAYLAKIQPAYPSINYPNTKWDERLYAQVMTFLLFYISDTFGRMISSKIHRPSLLYPRLLFFICLSRFLFIFLFGFCHFPNTNGYPYIFQYDVIYGLLVLIFAISHGYCNALNMMYAPRRVHTQLSSTVGALLMMAHTSGVFVGSLLSYGIVAIYGVHKSHTNQHF